MNDSEAGDRDVWRELGLLQDRVEQLERTVEAIRILGEEFWRNELVGLMQIQHLNGWSYDENSPHGILSNSFKFERIKNAEGGTRSRQWINAECEAETRIMLNRAFAYQFRIELSAFLDERLKPSFRVEFDGKPAEQTEEKRLCYKAVVPPKPGAASLKIKMSVDKALLPEGATVSFSLCSIDISPI